MIDVTRARFRAQARRESRETIHGAGVEERPVTKALWNQNVWLTVGYVALILLLSRTYA